MPEKKNFFLLAIIVGIAGVIIGGYSIISMTSNLLSP